MRDPLSGRAPFLFNETFKILIPMKKFEVTNVNGSYHGKPVFRIKALKEFYNPSFGFVHAGDFGGWVSSDKNLSQYGSCWIAGDAVVCENSRVIGSALVNSYAAICGKCLVKDHANIYGHARLFDSVIVAGDSAICGDAFLCGNMYVCDEVHTQATWLA